MLDWDKTFSEQSAQVKESLNKLFAQYLSEHFTGVPNAEGQNIYKEIVFESRLAGSPNPEQRASLLLSQYGIKGIRYLDASSRRAGEGTYNYVIFDDNEIKITQTFFQFLDDQLLDDAVQYNTWEEFRDNNEEGSNVSASDNAWYKSLWEDARKISRQSQTLFSAEDETSGSKTRAEELDRRWLAEETSREKLIDILKTINNIVNSREAEPMEGEDRTEYNRNRLLESRLKMELPNWNTWQGIAAQAVNGPALTNHQYERLKKLIRQAPRDYRAVFADLMGQNEYLEDLGPRAENGEPASRLADPRGERENIQETLRSIARELGDEELSRRVEAGDVSMGDDPRVQAYIKGIETGEKANIDALTALEAEIGEDWARFTNHEKRELADRYEKMLQMKEAWGDRQDKTARLIEEGRSITEPYKKQQRLEKASYDQAMKAFEDYRKSSALEADIRESMARQEARSQERIKQTGIRRRMRAMRALKELKKRLIKRIVRNVSFKNFAYDQAAMIKAIQRIFQPSLIEGVNKWIGGKEGPLIREIWSRWRTDEAYREELTTAAGKKANRIAKILDKEWDFISNQEKESLIKAMPKQDWITDLGLVELARENDESIQLDIEEQIINGEMHYVLGENLAKKMKEDLGEELYNRLINKPLAAWSITEAEELAAAVDRLTIEGKHELAARNEARSNLRDRFRDQVKKAIRTTGIEINDDDSVEEKKRKQVKINKIIGKYASGKIKNNLSNNFFDANLRRFTTAMDGGRQGIYTSLLYWGENDAYNAKHRALQTRQQRIDEVMVKNKITLDELYQTIDIPGLDTDLDIFYGNRGRQLTVDDLLYIRRGSQNELTRRAIAYGNLSNAEERAQFEKERDIEKSMSEFGNLAEGRIRLVMDYAHDFFNKEENKKFLELEKAIGQDYDQNGERLNRACIDMFNKPMWREENYVPMNRRDQTGGENENRVIEDLLGIEGVGSKWVNKGFSEKRINISPFHQMPIELGLYKTWASSVEATEHLVAYGPLVQNLNNVFKGYGTADVRRTIENRWGKAATGYIDDAIAEMAKPNPTLHRSAADNIIRNLRGAAATAYLAWKLSGILKQAVTSPWPYLQEINPKDYIAAALEVAFGAGKINDFIEEASIFMKNRDPSIMFELIREQMQKTDNRIGHILDKFNTMGMKGLEWIDWAAVAPGWLAKFRTELRRLTAERDAAYEAKLKEYRGSQYNDVLPTEESKAARALEETMGPDEIKYQAVALADDAVRRMQPSSRSTDLAPLFKNRNEAISVFLQFQTALNVIWQNIRYDLPLAMREKKVGTIVGMVTGYAMAGICLGLLTEGLGGDDDDEVTKARNLLFYSFTQFTDSVPVIGNSVTWAAGSFVTGKSRWIGNSAPLAVMDKAFQGIGTLGTLIWEDEEIKRNKKIQRTISLLAEAFGIAAGLPVSGIKELGLTAGIGDGDGELNFNWEALLGRRK